MTFAQRLNHLNERIKELFRKQRQDDRFMKCFRFGKPGSDITNQVLKEEIIHEIKKLIDILAITVVTYEHSVANNIDRYESNHSIPLDNYTQLWKYKFSDSVYEKLGVNQHMSLLRFINNLHNAYKHDLLAIRTENLIASEPFVLTMKFKDSKTNLNEIQEFVCSFRDLIMACDEYISAVLNQKASTTEPNYEIKNP